MVNPVFVALNRRMTVFGVDRGIFMVLVVISVAVFWLTSIPWAVLVFAVLFGAVRLATKKDPQLPEIILATSKMGALYE